MRTKLKTAELEAAIIKKLAEHPDCVGIVQVYVKAAGREPPEETWTRTLVSRRPVRPPIEWARWNVSLGSVVALAWPAKLVGEGWQEHLRCWWFVAKRFMRPDRVVVVRI